MVGSLFLTIALAWLANGDGPQCPDAALQATYLVGDEVKDAAKHASVAGCTRLEPIVESGWPDEEMCSDEPIPARPNRHVVIELHILNAPTELAGKLGSDIFITADQLKDLTTDRGGHLLCRPTMFTANGQLVEYTAFPSELLPYITGNTVFEAASIPGLNGLSFKLKPRVSADDRFVRLDLQGEASFCLGGNCSGANQTCTAQMQAEVPEGKTVALRGLTYPAQSCSEVPVLSEIPLIGEMFKSSCGKPESVVMLATVHIVDDRGQPVALSAGPSEREPSFQQCPGCCEPSAVATVEDNLEKLQTAQELYNLALLYERLNLPEVASEILSNVQTVCPGSRIASQSQERCNTLPHLEFGKHLQNVTETSQSGYQPLASVPATAYCPKEGAKVAQVAYVIEPPDLLTIELFKSAPDRPLTGERLVRTDGTVDLGFYGSVQVAGMTIDQARARVEKYLSTTIRDPKVHLDVYSYNSKGYYVIADGGGKGDQTVRLPFTGNETVLDAIAQIGGLPPASDSTRIWLARPGTGVMPINWNAIVKAGDPTTNYQMQPMDRIYISTAPAVRNESATAGMLKLTGGEEADALTPVKDSKLARLLTSYRHACSDGNVDLARQLAIEALAIDPTCFGK